MRILVWVPCRPYEAVEPIWHIVKWAQGGEWETKRKHDVYIHGDFRSTALSTSRSAAIDYAKAHNVDILIVVDSDVTPSTPLNEIVGYLNQAFSRGFGCVISPGVTRSRTVGVHPPGEGNPVYESIRDVPFNLFEISAGTGGFMAFGRECIERIEPMDSSTVDGKKDGKATSVVVHNYCHWTEGESEDYSLQHHIAKSTGLKIGADTRLRTDHIKFFAIPSWREGLV